MSSTSSNRIAMLFLSAGASRRMGRSKALLPWHGQSVIAHHFQTLETIPSIDPWVVTQPTDQPLFDELAQIAWPAAHRQINAQAPDCDMFESIRAGVLGMLEAPEKYTSVGIALIDQPCIKPTTFQHLVEAIRLEPDSILQPAFENRRGHPVLLPAAIAHELVLFTGPSLRHFLADHNAHRKTVPVNDPGIHLDMDTPAAYQQLLQTTGENHE